MVTGKTPPPHSQLCVFTICSVEQQLRVCLLNKPGGLHESRPSAEPEQPAEESTFEQQDGVSAGDGAPLMMLHEDQTAH